MKAVRLSALVLSATAILTLAACSDSPPADEVQTGNQVDAAAPQASTTSLSPAAPPAGTATPVADDAIPVDMRGLWGINRADCDSSRGDDKGSMKVGADKLEFYEAVARLGPITTVSAERLRASFAFSGEGETWTQDMDLMLAGDGQSLVRRDSGPDALPEPLIYLRCPA